MKLRKILLLVFFTNIIVNASTIFTLSGVNKLYLVVEISGKTIPKSYKSMIMESLKTVTDDLKIDTTGYDPRSLAVLVSETKVNESTLINIQLLIGEEVKRLDNNVKTFALTYQSMGHFVLNNNDDGFISLPYFLVCSVYGSFDSIIINSFFLFKKEDHNRPAW